MTKNFLLIGTLCMLIVGCIDDNTPKTITVHSEGEYFNVELTSTENRGQPSVDLSDFITGDQLKLLASNNKKLLKENKKINDGFKSFIIEGKLIYPSSRSDSIPKDLFETAPESIKKHLDVYYDKNERYSYNNTIIVNTYYSKRINAYDLTSDYPRYRHYLIGKSSSLGVANRNYIIHLNKRQTFNHDLSNRKKIKVRITEVIDNFEYKGDIIID